MKVKVCKNCNWWSTAGIGRTAGWCQRNSVNTLDLATCSIFAYPAHASDHDHKGGGGGDDDGPVDITPRGPSGGQQLTYKGAPIYWGGPVSGYTPALIPYDPDGDKKD